MLAAASTDADVRDLTQVRTREWLQATDEMSRHQRASWVRSVCRRNVAVVYRSHRLDGREVLIELLERDLALGVDLTLQRVVAGRGITIMEGQYANPPEDPFHCPPETTQVFLGSGGEVHTILVHFSARVANPE